MGAQQRGRQLRPGALPARARRRSWNADGSLNPNGPGFQTVNGVPFYLNGMGLAGQNGFPKGLVENDYNTLQPRVGFSEDLFGNGKTVLRGGFGTFYERMQGNDIYNAATGSAVRLQPAGKQRLLLSTRARAGSQAQTAATPFFASGDGPTLRKSYKAPAVAQFSLGIQHELKPSMIWVVQYVGNLAWHQNIERDINNFPLTTDLSHPLRRGGRKRQVSPAIVCPQRRRRRPTCRTPTSTAPIQGYRATSTRKKTPPTATTTASRLVCVCRTSGA